MSVDASAVIALLSGEKEAERVAEALSAAPVKVTSPVALLKMVLALARPDNFNRPVEEIEGAVRRFLSEWDIVVRHMPPAKELSRLVLSAAARFRARLRGLDLGDCFHYV